VEHQSSVREVYIDGLKLFLDEVLTREERGGGAAPAPASRPVIEMPSGGLEAFGEAFARHGEMMARLGERMAELHAALADARGDERFEPERLGTLEARSVYQSMRNTVIPALRRLGEGLDDLSGGVRADAEALLGREDELIGRLRAVAEAPIDSLRIRCYGNLELDHILWTGRDFVFTEFESDPRRRLAETRIRQSALDDVAALLTDMDHTAVVVAQEQAAGGAVPAPSEAVSRLGPWASRWAALTGGALVGGYRSRVLEVGPDLVPSDERGLSVLFDGEMLRRAAWRMHLSLVRRPGEVGLAIGRLGRLLDAPPSSSADGGSGGGEATHPSVG
jgi:maltose alpha-D-glucosyltransferase/alpha-amylase